jgi:hypothetical protein
MEMQSFGRNQQLGEAAARRPVIGISSLLDRSQSPYNAARRSPSPYNNRDAYVRSLFQRPATTEEGEEAQESKK